MRQLHVPSLQHYEVDETRIQFCPNFCENVTVIHEYCEAADREKDPYDSDGQISTISIRPDINVPASLQLDHGNSCIQRLRVI